jgi:hypothetical protein
MRSAGLVVHQVACDTAVLLSHLAKKSAHVSITISYNLLVQAGKTSSEHGSVNMV